jgi:hypothetical protein
MPNSEADVGSMALESLDARFGDIIPDLSKLKIENQMLVQTHLHALIVGTSDQVRFIRARIEIHKINTLETSEIKIVRIVIASHTFL